MKILVTSGSRHGSTRGIARAIAEELGRHGHVVVERDVKHAPAAAGFDAVVVGSAVYIGSWLPDAVRYVEANAESLAGLPTWLFSSGPLGADDPKPDGDPATLPALLASTRARGHVTFVGRLERDGLAWHERLIVGAVRAPYGDFRDWNAIRAWAGDIARELADLAVPAGQQRATSARPSGEGTGTGRTP